MSDQANKSIVILSTLSIVATCLAVLNLYLGVWILRQGRGAVSLLNFESSEPDSTRITRLSLPEQQDKSLFPDAIQILNSDTQQAIKFQPRLIARRQLDVGVIQTKHDNNQVPLRISSSKSAINFRISFKNHTSSGDLLKLEPSSQQLTFAHPFQLVRARHKSPGSPNHQEVFFKCGRELVSQRDEPLCSFPGEIRKLVLPNKRAIEGPRVFQASTIETDRVHSATNRLVVRSTNDVLFRTRSSKLSLESFADLRINSLKSQVILNSTTIKLRLMHSTAHKHEANQYKLCICGSQSSGIRSSGGSGTRHPRGRSGMLFGIRNSLACASFNSYCSGSS